MTYSSLRTTLLSFIVAAIVLAPTASFAKEKGKEHEDKSERSERSNKLSCLRAFGHLIAPGWIKMKGEAGIEGRCFLPFGIGKKLNGSGTTTPPVADTTSPVITDVLARPEMTSAVVSWTTDERADSAVYFSPSSPVNTQSSSTPLIEKKGKTTRHKIAVQGLAASTTYYAVVRSRDAAGNAAYSPEFSFTTKSPAVVGDTTPPIIHTVVAVMGTSTASIGWTTNEPATSKVFYGLTTPVNISAATTSFVESTALTTNHLLTVLGLATSTKYYFVVQSKDAAGNTRSSAEFSATTGI